MATTLRQAPAGRRTSCPRPKDQRTVRRKQEDLMQTVRIPDDVARTLVSSPAYATDAIHEAYRWLRSNNPLGVAEVEGFDPFWVVTKHADILEISRNNARFPSAVRGTTLTSR